jgi:hypothetical protein
MSPWVSLVPMMGGLFTGGPQSFGLKISAEPSTELTPKARSKPSAERYPVWEPTKPEASSGLNVLIILSHERRILNE